ncbi:DUF2384 domain-containing protein [archaeon]|nr:DUF2384 domain-containing protein [archaeon]
MNIDDILKQEKFKELDVFLNEEMIKLAGQDLVKKMTSIWGSEKAARDWFYSSALGLGDKRPYDYCKEGKKKDVEALLGRIAYDIYS